MADPPPPSGEWLPPQAPGGRPPPRFVPQPEPRFAPPVAPPQQAPPPQPAAPPVFVKPQTGRAGGLAVAALILSISSLLFLVLSLGLSFALSLPLSAAAWVCAAKDKAAIRAGRREGGGHAQVGLVLAMVGVALSVAAMVVWIGLIAAGFSLEELQRNLEQELERQRQRQRGSDDPVSRLRELSAAAASLLGR